MLESDAKEKQFMIQKLRKLVYVAIVALRLATWGSVVIEAINFCNLDRLKSQNK